MSPKCALKLIAFLILLINACVVLAKIPVKTKQSQQLQDNSASTELRCPSCEQIHCQPRRAKRLRCKGGTTLGICNCCPVCAKLEGDSCGGQWNYLGRCDHGLVCEVQENTIWQRRTGPSLSSIVYSISKGICKKLPENLLTSDQGHAAYCKPKCSPELCRKSPGAICSAVGDTAEQGRACQGGCQHTSCRACRFVQRQPDCGKCAFDDFRCMKDFARCVRKDFCNRTKFPCRKAGWGEDERGKFMCLVPECLET